MHTHLANTNVHRSQRKSEDPAKTTYSIFAFSSCLAAPEQSRLMACSTCESNGRNQPDKVTGKVRERTGDRSQSDMLCKQLGVQSAVVV